MTNEDQDETADQVAETGAVVGAGHSYALLRFLRERELPLIAFVALFVVARDGSVKISGLASELAISVPVASKLASDLVKRGYLVRRVDLQNRSSRVLSLTKNGREAITKAVDQLYASPLS